MCGQRLLPFPPPLPPPASPCSWGHGPRLCPMAGPVLYTWPTQKQRVPVAPLRACWPRTKDSNLSLWSILGPLPKDSAERVWVCHVGYDPSPYLPFHLSPNPNTPSSVQPSWTSGRMSPLCSVLPSPGVLPVASHLMLRTSAPNSGGRVDNVRR